MPDITAGTREESLVAPPTAPRIRKQRFGAVAFGVVATLGLGLAGGANMHRLVDIDQTATWLGETASMLQSGLEAARSEIGRRIESFTSRPVSVAQASQEATSARPSNDDLIERAVADLTLRLDQVRAATEGSARDVGAGIEHLRSSAEQSHRELDDKLVQLAERVERIERQAAAAAAPVFAQPVVQQTASSPSKPMAKPVPQPTPDAKPKVASKQATTETKPGIDARGIANWTVRDGTAVLEGPQGIIEVSPGDTVPAIGQVQAIVRSGRRWVVATTKGVITPH
jgi:hypothetical protein